MSIVKETEKQLAQGSDVTVDASQSTENVKATANDSDAASETILTPKKSNTRKRNTIIGAVVTVMLAIILSVAIINNGSGRVNKYLDLGNKALEEYNFEEAIIQFAKVIDIDPMNVDAYLGMVEAYIELSDYDAALEWAMTGYEKTGNTTLKEKVDMIESGVIYDALGRVHRAKNYSQGKLISIFEYEYIKERRSALLRLDANDNVAYRLDYEYDELGRMIVGARLTAADALYRGIFEYEGDSNRMSKVTQYHEDGTLYSIVTFVYDERNRILEEKEEYATADYGEIRKYTYAGDTEYCTKIERYNLDENLKETQDNEYDDDWNRISITTYNSYGEYISKWVYEYDDDGKCVRIDEYDADGKIRNSVEYQ